MIDQQTVDGYIALFRGRGDCFGSWTGGCIREPVTRDMFRQHLDGTRLFGMYPSFNTTYAGEDGHTVCVWGCSDIDKTDDPAQAAAISEALNVQGIHPWIERTAHGFHVWVFATQLLPARDMRRMFLAAHQVAGVPAKEVNPKQETLPAGVVGNYVRLPYPGGLPERRMIFSDSGGEWFEHPLNEFVQLALQWRDTPERIAHLASYHIPPAPTLKQSALPSLDMLEAASRLSAVGRSIFRDGPLPGKDRSTALLRLVHKCFEANLAPEDCRLLVEDADLRWGKFLARGHRGEQELLKLIAKVYSAGGFNGSI